jgi:hypothetical protein
VAASGEAAVGAGPQDDPVVAGVEYVDVRETTLSGYAGHGDTSAGEAGHEAYFGSASPSHEADAAWEDSSALF